MEHEYSRHFNGTINVLDKPIKLLFGKIGKHLDPGFVVTSFNDDIGFLVKREKSKFKITHSNFFLDSPERRKLEGAVNKIIQLNGMKKAA
jgi:hypothetical protein